MLAVGSSERRSLPESLNCQICVIDQTSTRMTAIPPEYSGRTVLPNLECSLYGLVETATIPSLLDRLVAICGDVQRGILEKPDYEEHEVALVSTAPPNAEGVRPDETMVRLSSLVYDEKTKERVLDVDAREW